MRPRRSVGNRRSQCRRLMATMDGVNRPQVHKSPAAATMLGPQRATGRLAVNLCRADQFLLASGVAVLGSAAAFGPSALSIGLPFGAHALLMLDGIFRPASPVLYPT